MKPLARILVLPVPAAAWAAPSPVFAAESGFATAQISAAAFFPEFEHNVADVTSAFADGAPYRAPFLRHFERTGGLERWGFPTSSVFEDTSGTLTPYYQRGVVDWRSPPEGGAHIFLRRLARDYVGGGLGGAEDQGVEPDLTNPNPGETIGPWGHKVPGTNPLSAPSLFTGVARS